jgi:hypothetical protein
MLYFLFISDDYSNGEKLYKWDKMNRFPKNKQV